jgi:hypothetical protein
MPMTEQLLNYLFPRDTETLNDLIVVENGPSWLTAKKDLTRWLRTAHAGWDEKTPQPPRTDVAYIDAFGNRLWCCVQQSERIGDEQVNALATILGEPFRWEAAPTAPSALQ